LIAPLKFPPNKNNNNNNNSPTHCCSVDDPLANVVEPFVHDTQPVEFDDTE